MNTNKQKTDELSSTHNREDATRKSAPPAQEKKWQADGPKKRNCKSTENTTQKQEREIRRRSNNIKSTSGFKIRARKRTVKKKNKDTIRPKILKKKTLVPVSFFFVSRGQNLSMYIFFHFSSIEIAVFVFLLWRVNRFPILLPRRRLPLSAMW